VRSPEAFGEHHDFVVALGMFFSPEEASLERLDAEDVEEAFRDEHGLEYFGTLAAGVVEAVWLDAGQLLEARRPSTPVEKITGRNILSTRVGGVTFKQREEALGFLIGKRAQQDLRHDAERGDGRGHAEREDGDRRDRKAGLLAPLAEAVTQIVDRLQIGDVALAHPERIDERSECVTDDRDLRIPAGGGKLAFPFEPPFPAQPRRHEA
jgi:hypothetical protein